MLESVLDIVFEIDFVIFVGIFSLWFVIMVSVLLVCEFGLFNFSCWDFKLGCFIGILVLI